MERKTVCASLAWALSCTAGELCIGLGVDSLSKFRFPDAAEMRQVGWIGMLSACPPPRLWTLRYTRSNAYVCKNRSKIIIARGPHCLQPCAFSNIIDNQFAPRTLGGRPPSHFTIHPFRLYMQLTFCLSIMIYQKEEASPTCFHTNHSGSWGHHPPHTPHPTSRTFASSVSSSSSFTQQPATYSPTGDANDYGQHRLACPSRPRLD